MDNEEEECDTDLERQNVEELYDHVRHLHLTEAAEQSFDVQHPSLIPVLRPYQTQAVSWMLRREKYKSSSSQGFSKLYHHLCCMSVHENSSVLIYSLCVPCTEQRLHFLWREIITICGKKLFYNPYSGWYDTFSSLSSIY